MKIFMVNLIGFKEKLKIGVNYVKYLRLYSNKLKIIIYCY